MVHVPIAEEYPRWQPWLQAMYLFQHLRCPDLDEIASAARNCDNQQACYNISLSFD